MFSKILVPVDLEHQPALEKALSVATELTRLYDAEAILCGVTSSAPSAVAHSPSEFAQKLDAFAAEQTQKRGVSFAAKSVTSHDPATDIDSALQSAITETGADLVVMASHVPGMLEHVLASRAGFLAAHARVSVFVVR